MINYFFASLPLLIVFLTFLIRNETRITRIETTLDIHIENHNAFLSTLGRKTHAD